MRRPAHSYLYAFLTPLGEVKAHEAESFKLLFIFFKEGKLKL